VPDTPAATVNAIIPLAIGNQWVTHTASWDSAGRPSVTMVDSTRILRDTTLQLERWFVDKAGNCATNRTTGYWILSNSTPMMLLKYPAVLNDLYMFGTDTVRVVSLDTTVAVAAGTFQCICYKVTYTTQAVAHQILLASLNIGLIRREVVERTPGGREFLKSRADLQTFQLK
jgi:hypothetical protein